MIVREALRSSFPFHVSESQLEMIATSRGLDLDGMFDSSVASGREFNLAKADVIKTIVMTPNVSEGGVSISFNDKAGMIAIANSIYGAYGEPLLGHETPTVKPLDW